MGLYEPKGCCFCCDTKTGSLVIGSLYLIGSILILIIMRAGFVLGTTDSHYDKDNIIIYMCITALVVSILTGLTSCLFIHGINMDRPGLMLPFLIFRVVSIILLFIRALAAFILPLKDGGNVLGGCLMISVLLEMYFYLVINAYYKQVKRNLSNDHQIL